MTPKPPPAPAAARTPRHGGAPPLDGTGAAAGRGGAPALGGAPSLGGIPAPPERFVLELPATADFAEGGLGRQCAVLCKAGCCKYYSLPLETPRTDAHFDDIRWYLLHEGTHVYKHDGDWFLLVLNECRHLLPNNLCGIYETRPRICREYDPTDCEYTGEVEYELYFDGADKLEAWLAEREAKLARRRKRPAPATR